MEKKTGKNVLLVIMGGLIIVAIIARILKFPKSPVDTIAYSISLVFTALYGFWFYKKPHGNMLKFAMLIFALTTTITSCCSMVSKGVVNHQIIKIIALLIVCYCAGRLNRIDQNKYLMSILCLVFLGLSIYTVIGTIMDQSITFASTIRHFSYTINYITLMIAYFVRYKEHKEAGLLDSPRE